MYVIYINRDDLVWSGFMTYQTIVGYLIPYPFIYIYNSSILNNLVLASVQFFVLRSVKSKNRSTSNDSV